MIRPHKRTNASIIILVYILGGGLVKLILFEKNQKSKGNFQFLGKVEQFCEQLQIFQKKFELVAY